MARRASDFPRTTRRRTEEDFPRRTRPGRGEEDFRRSTDPTRFGQVPDRGMRRGVSDILQAPLADTEQLEEVRQREYAELPYGQRIIRASLNQDWKALPELAAVPEGSEFAERIEHRARLVSTLDYDLFPTDYARTQARDALLRMPADAMLGLLASDAITDEQVIETALAYGMEKTREKLSEEFGSLPPKVRKEYESLRKFGWTEEEALARAGKDAGLDEQELDRYLSARLFGAIEADPVEMSTFEKVWSGEPFEWLVQTLADNAVTDTLVRVGELPKRGLDWLTREAARMSGTAGAAAGLVAGGAAGLAAGGPSGMVTGGTTGAMTFGPEEHTVPDDATLGQVFAGPALGLDPESLEYRLLSGTMDTTALISADTFLVAGRGLKAARARKAISSLDDVLKWSDSTGFNRFTKWLEGIPKDQRAGHLSRAKEMFGWQVDDARFFARVADADNAGQMRQAVLDSAREGWIGTLPTFPVYGTSREAIERAFDGRWNLLRHTWTNRMQPTRVEFERHFRRFADTLLGDPAETDRYLSRVLETPNVNKTKRLRETTDEIISTWLEREGVTRDVYDEATKLLAKTGNGNYWERSRSVIAHVRDDGAVKKVRRTVLPTQVRNYVDVPNYQDIVDLERAMKHVAGKRRLSLPQSVQHAFRDLAEKWHNLAVRVFITNPRLGLKIYGDEFSYSALDIHAGRNFVSQTFLDRILPGTAPIRDETIARLAKEAAEDIPGEYLASGARNIYFSSGSTQASTARMRKAQQAAAKDAAEMYGIDWALVEKTNPAYDQAMYHVINHQILQTPLGRLAVDHADDADRLTIMRRWLTDTEEGQLFMRQVPDEGLDLQGFQGVYRQARKAEILAKDAAGFVDYHIPRESFLFNRLARTKRIDLEDIARHRAELPDEVYGPRFEAMDGQSPIKKFVKGAEGKVWSFNGKIIDGVRTKAFKAYSAQKLEQLKTLNDSLRRMGLEPVDEMHQVRLARNHAIEKMMRFENPLERTRLGARMRNLSLFVDQQLSFQKRWGRVALQNPGMVSQLRKLIPAAENLGLAERDPDTGAVSIHVPIDPSYWDWFFTEGGEHPSTKFMRSLVFRLGRTGRLSGPSGWINAPFQLAGQAFIPQVVPFAFQNDFSAAPAVELPATLLMDFKPELRGMVRDVFGEYAAMPTDGASLSDLVADAFAASWMRSLSSAILGPEGDEIAGSAYVDYMKWLSLKRGDDSFFDPEKREEMQKAAKSNIRWMTFAGALSRFAFPYAMMPNQHTRELFREYRDTLDNAPTYQEGIKDWLDRYGASGIPMTVSTSRSVLETELGEKRETVVSMPPTDAGLKFLREHPDFVKEYRDIAGIFMVTEEDDYNPDAFLDQIHQGYRESLEAHQWKAQVLVQAANRVWYDAVLPHVIALEEAGLHEKAKEDRETAREYLSERYPGWEDHQSKGQERQSAEDRAYDDLLRAVQDSAVADREDVQPLRVYLKEIEMAKQKADQLDLTLGGGSKALTPIRRHLRETYQKLYDATGSQPLRVAYEQLLRDLTDPTSDRLQEGR